MRLCAFFGLVLLMFSFAGCERDTTQPSPTASNEVFPEPKASEERSTFEKLAAKKKDFEAKRKSLIDTQLAQANDFIAKNPEAKPPAGGASDGGPPPPPPSEAARAARRELGQMYRSFTKPRVDLNLEYLTFLNAEYFPGLLKYSEYCHKTFLAEPNKANGGALVQLVAELYDNGNVDEAFLYSTDLAKNGFDSGELDDLIAASAYCTDHFSEAAEFFNKAMEKSKYVRASLVANKEDIATSQKAWDGEKAIRDKEASSNDLPRVKLETEVGDIVFELYENEAPETVGNFISLVESGYYDNTTFHSHVLTAHVFTGSKNGDAKGNPGYTIYGESEKPDRRFPFRGSLTMSAPGNNAGAIYSISFRPSPYNFGYYTTFGRVVEGFDVLPKIAKFVAREPMVGMEQTKIKKATVLRKRDHEYKPHKVE